MIYRLLQSIESTETACLAKFAPSARDAMKGRAALSLSTSREIHGIFADLARAQRRSGGLRTRRQALDQAYEYRFAEYEHEFGD